MLWNSSSTSNLVLCATSPPKKTYFVFEFRWRRIHVTSCWWLPRLRMEFRHGFPIGLLFLFSSCEFVWNISFDIFPKGPRSSPSISWLVTRKTKILLGDCQSVFTKCPQQLLVLASWIPTFLNSCFSAWFLSRMFLNYSDNAVPVEARSSLTAMVLRSA